VFERFTDDARAAVVYAQEESRLFRHDHIATEHLLLGLLHGDDDTVRALESFGVTLAAARQQLEDFRGRGRREPRGHIPFTPGAKQALELSLRVSQRLGSDHIGKPHVLRGILQTSDGSGIQILRTLDVDLDALASVADEVARGSAGGGAEGQAWTTRHGIMLGAEGGGIERELTAEQPGAQTARSAGERRRLADALKRYARHDQGCDPERCTCGLGPLLAQAAQE
jgi:ATP-dependent Clp protease ATP-binding subunit ClpC